MAKGTAIPEHKRSVIAGGNGKPGCPTTTEGMTTQFGINSTSVSKGFVVTLVGIIDFCSQMNVVYSLFALNDCVS